MIPTGGFFTKAGHAAAVPGAHTLTPSSDVMAVINNPRLLKFSPNPAYCVVTRLLVEGIGALWAEPTAAGGFGIESGVMRSARTSAVSRANAISRASGRER